MNETSRLTTTRLASLRRCPRQHYYRYELGLSRTREKDALRLGSAFHVGMEAKNGGLDAERAVAHATVGYDERPAWADPWEWEIERETVRHLLTGYFWRYGLDDLKVLAAEQTFEMPLVHPVTGEVSADFVLAGKIDAIVQLPDGRLAVLEYKTAGEDISSDSDYWLRLRCDPQISQYVLAARALGFDVATVLYDVTRKPTIKPVQVPILDEAGEKIVLDAQGSRVLTAAGKLRKTGDSAKGFVLQSRPESPAEYGERLLADIGDRPDFYFQRREVPRLEDDLAEFRVELWQQAEQLADTRRHGRWFRNVGKMTCDYCQFANLCLNSIRVEPGVAPSGFEILRDVHPELAAA